MLFNAWCPTLIFKGGVARKSLPQASDLQPQNLYTHMVLHLPHRIATVAHEPNKRKGPQNTGTAPPPTARVALGILTATRASALSAATRSGAIERAFLHRCSPDMITDQYDLSDRKSEPSNRDTQELENEPIR